MNNELERIKKLMVVSGTPYFKLSATMGKFGGQKSNLGNNYPKTTEDENEPEKTPEQGFEDLKTLIEVHDRPGVIFEAEFKRSEKSNGGNVIGPITFELTEAQTLGSTKQITAENSLNLFGSEQLKQQMLGAIEAERSLNEPRLELERQRNGLALKEILHQQEKERFAEEKKAFEDYKREAEAKLNSRAAIGLKSIEAFAEKHLPSIIGGIDLTGGNAKPLGATPAAEAPAAEAPQSPAEQLIEKIGQKLYDWYDGGNVDILDVQQLEQKIIEAIKQIKAEKGAQTNE